MYQLFYETVILIAAPIVEQFGWQKPMVVDKFFQLMVQSPYRKTTRYFEERVLAKRPYLKREWCEQALTASVHHEVQPEDQRVRYWIFIDELGKYLRVVTLADGETVHNAFPDRNFKGKP